MAWQQEIARRLRPLFGAQVRSGAQSRSGRDGCDVEGAPWWVECKKGKRPNLRSAMRQGEEATDGRHVIAVVRDDQEVPGEGGSEWVVMRWETFDQMIRDAQRGAVG